MYLFSTRRIPGLVGLILAMMAMTAVFPAGAQVSTQGSIDADSLWYYQMGGGRSTSRAAYDASISQTIGLGGDASIGFSCGKFSPIAAITNQFENMADNIATQLTNAATGALGALPMLVLQKANPGLYDLFQNTLLRFEALVSVTTKSCEQMESEIAAGKDPFQDWITIANGEHWKATIGSGGDDIVSAKKEVDDAAGTDGITWIGGKKKGGKGKDQIEVMKDVAQAGYNTVLNRKPEATGNVSGKAADSPLGRTWGSAKEAGEWVSSVLGDEIVSTCGTDDGCEPSKGVAGIGLGADMATEEKQVHEDLIDLVNDGGADLTAANLESVSAPDIKVTRKLILAMRQLGTDFATSTTEKLAGEIALARSVNKALLARRILLSGREIPEIQGLDAATTRVDRGIATLQSEVEMLVFESDVRKRLMSTTASDALKMAEATRRSGRGQMGGAFVNPNTLDNGSVAK